MAAPAVLAVTPYEVLVASRSNPAVAWRVPRAGGTVAYECACPAVAPRCAHVRAAEAAVAEHLRPRGCDLDFDALGVPV